MSLTAKEIILMREPATPDNVRMDSLIDYAGERYSAKYLGKQHENATALLVLHMLTIEKSGLTGTSGTITAEREGELSRSYGGTGTADNSGYLGQTSYSAELANLLKTIPKTPLNRTF